MELTIIHKKCGGTIIFDSFGNFKCEECGLVSKDQDLIDVKES